MTKIDHEKLKRNEKARPREQPKPDDGQDSPFSARDAQLRAENAQKRRGRLQTPPRKPAKGSLWYAQALPHIRRWIKRDRAAISPEDAVRVEELLERCGPKHVVGRLTREDKMHIDKVWKPLQEADFQRRMREKAARQRAAQPTWRRRIGPLHNPDV